MTPFWKWNIGLSLAWVGYKMIDKAAASPTTSSAARPAALPSTNFPSPYPPLRPATLPSPTLTGPLARGVAANTLPSTPSSASLPGGSPPAALPSAPSASPPSLNTGGYQWVRAAAAGTLESPQNGDTVFCQLQDVSGTNYTIMLDAQAIDEVGNFVGEVTNAGGCPVLAAGQVITVPLAAISWMQSQGVS
jgi:hypothetical protein